MRPAMMVLVIIALGLAVSVAMKMVQLTSGDGGVWVFLGVYVGFALAASRIKD